MEQLQIVKITENLAKLGESGISTPITSDNRNAMKGILSGLGYKADDYIKLTLAQLESARSALAVGDNYGLPEGAIERQSAAYNWQQYLEAVKNGFATPSAPEADSDMAAEIAEIIKKHTPKAASLDEKRVIGLIKEHCLKTVVEIKTPTESKSHDIGFHHEILPTLLKAVNTEKRLNIFLVGGAGSGKTTIVHQIAEILGLPFYFNGAISSEYKLTGFVDAQGRIISTAFRKAYENGGVYLFDEVDASLADATLAFNAALSNGHMDFPDGSVARHKDFHCFAAGNTSGGGATRRYIGRNALDGAFKNRFVTFKMEYDEKLEYALAGNDQWTKTVIKLRKATDDLGIDHIISPRASISGAQLLAAGLSEREVLEACIFDGLDKDSVVKLRTKAGI